MVYPGDLTDAITAKLQSIAGLVAILGGDVKRIFPYRRSFPNAVVLMDAIYRMPVPSIMVVWEGTIPGRLNQMEVWKHRFGLYLRFADVVRGDASKGAYDMWEHAINGIPTGTGADGLKLLRTSIHESCYPMDPPAVIPQAGQTADSGTTFEYFKVNFSLTERGDW
jgi:hypothetical protein